jgi:hypothetical protein
VFGGKSKATWGPPSPPPTAGGRLGARTGDRGQIYQAGGNITRSTVNINRNTGWTAFAVLIAAAAGAVGVYALAADQSGKSSGQVPSLSPGGTSAAGPPSGDDAAKAPGADTRSRTRQDQPAEPAERWRGTVLLDLDTEGRELDTDRPSEATSLLFGADIGLGFGDTGWQVVAGAGGAIASWEQGKEPGQADCAASTDTTGSYMAPLKRSAVLCVRTNEGRIARLEVTKLLDGFALAVEFDAVVWELSRSQRG